MPRSKINSRQELITIEDPVEYQLKGIGRYR
jgi:type II secretory ATPase GspE/PulE/Tfp pilus assembly ATPase PilB-like protein